MLHAQEPIKAALAEAQEQGDLDILCRPVIAQRYREALARAVRADCRRGRGRRLTALASAPSFRPAQRRISDLPWPVWLFIASMVIPAQFYVELDGIRIGPQRLVLLAAAAGILHWIWATGPAAAARIS